LIDEVPIHATQLSRVYALALTAARDLNRRAFIRSTVAIIIHAITVDIGCTHSGLTGIYQSAILTKTLPSRRAQTCSTLSTRRNEVFIDLVIAIVIHAIAGAIGAGPTRWGADIVSPAYTGGYTNFARALTTADRSLVNSTITVFIDTRAHILDGEIYLLTLYSAADTYGVTEFTDPV